MRLFSHVSLQPPARPRSRDPGDKWCQDTREPKLGWRQTYVPSLLGRVLHAQRAHCKSPYPLSNPLPGRQKSILHLPLQFQIRSMVYRGALELQDVGFFEPYRDPTPSNQWQGHDAP